MRYTALVRRYLQWSTAMGSCAVLCRLKMCLSCRLCRVGSWHLGEHLSASVARLGQLPPVVATAFSAGFADPDWAGNES